MGLSVPKLKRRRDHCVLSTKCTVTHAQNTFQGVYFSCLLTDDHATITSLYHVAASNTSGRNHNAPL